MRKRTKAHATASPRLIKLAILTNGGASVRRHGADKTDKLTSADGLELQIIMQILTTQGQLLTEGALTTLTSARHCHASAPTTLQARERTNYYTTGALPHLLHDRRANAPTTTLRRANAPTTTLQAR